MGVVLEPCRAYLIRFKPTAYKPITIIC